MSTDGRIGTHSDLLEPCLPSASRENLVGAEFEAMASCASGVAMCSVAAPSAAASVSFVSRSSSTVRFPVTLAAPSVRPLSLRFSRVVAMSSGPNTSGVEKIKESVVSGAETLVEKIRDSISTAQTVCEGNPTSEECVVAWDEVEELSAAASHKRNSTAPADSKDPLEKYCEDNPETDECRVYED